MSQKTTEVQIKPTKGKHMLTWVGKHPVRSIIAYPAQLVETIGETKSNNLLNACVDWSDWPQGYSKSGLLFYGDNKDVLAHLLSMGFRGKVKLIYIDPPFDSGANYVRSIKLRNLKMKPIDGETYELGEQIQYTDIWSNDMYLQFMYERLILLKEFLTSDGSIFLHCDWHKGHLIRCLLDEVFGAEGFKNEIIWRYSKYQMRGMSRFVNNHDVIYWYSKSDRPTYNIVTEELTSPKELKRKRWDKETAKIVNVRDENGQLIYDTYTEGKVDDVWDIDIIGATSGERAEYKTQKPMALLDRIIWASSSPGDIVMDAFMGSGTTALVAQKFGRRWIGVDINKGAIQTTIKRLQVMIQDQVSFLMKKGNQLPGLEDKSPRPCQLSFSVYRVNDYDLQIQHNEAFNLAIEHLGMTRTKTDSFFEGTLGKRLVKIIPFNHPLTPLDLEEIKKELSNRPEESRDIVVVCLGKEQMVDGWMADWNRIRRQGDFPNKIDVVELRSDPKYGGFFVHEPDQAMVKFEQKGDRVVITVENFLSPTIIQRLEQQAGGPLLKPQITDWRAMVDSIMIDTNYDGQVFNVVMADVPEKKSDFVSGKYICDFPKGVTNIAVKITDMLGEEVLVVKPYPF